MICVAGIYEVDKTSGGTVTRTVTYYPAGRAMRVNISGDSNTVYYLLKDHLGSASVVTDATDATMDEPHDPSVLRISLPNPKAEVCIIIPTPHFVFGGEPIASPDGESLEGAGETRLTSGTIYTDKLFTGQREITGLGIYHYQARFYSPRLGRFLSPDTIVPNLYNPQSLNRFSYVRNNPIKYTDPTGHAEWEEPYKCHGCTTSGTGGGTGA